MKTRTRSKTVTKHLEKTETDFKMQTADRPCYALVAIWRRKVGELRRLELADQVCSFRTVNPQSLK